MRHLGEQMAAQLNLNYFDLNNVSEHRMLQLVDVLLSISGEYRLRYLPFPSVAQLCRTAPLKKTNTADVTRSTAKAAGRAAVFFPATTTRAGAR